MTESTSGGCRSAGAGPLRIGLTGGIGAGKSTVAGLLREAGAAVVDADAIAREVVAPGQPALAALAEEFGPGVLTAEGELDRPALAAAAFASAEGTAALNAIMHPAIGERTRERIAGLADHAVVVHDVPLLVENGMGAAYHLCVLVDVPEEIRLDRLVRSRGLDRADAQRRIAQQADDAQRYAACDAVLDNSGAPGELRAQFERLWAGRIAPFARALAEGRPEPGAAARAEPETEAQAAVRAHAGARLHARLARVLTESGTLAEAALVETPSTPTSVPGVGLAFDLAAESGAVPELVRALTAAGWLPEAGASASAGERLFRHADPGQPARLRLRTWTLRLSAGRR
ncbi:dephospho-CoA kinase [Brevibacterium album]|uniref:dephospho-CoA kinase n=1 Tax=Brevibacterium album TaxID=417948 RepID=UPI0004170B66|nr:dephospho-CoA kinase [Brevibacterium album]